MKSVLLICPDMIDVKMAGPAIRYLNFSRELSKSLDVTLFIPNKESEFDFSSENFVVIKGDKNKLKASAKIVDSIVVQGLALRKYIFLNFIKKPIVIDMYDPFILENLELRSALKTKSRLTHHEIDLDIILEELKLGDYFICANEKQKDYYLGMLSSLNRINPLTYDKSPNGENIIGVVPFGIENSDPVKGDNVLKGVINGINNDDKLIIWGGGIWNWFDPITLIKAMKEIYKHRKDVKLFFMGIGHPKMDNDKKKAEECIALSKEYGLYNKTIFFNNWTLYSKRQDYLLEGDIGISTYENNLETRFSFRTRILDYLWCDLPMVLTEGDYMSSLVLEKSLGKICKPKDYIGLCKSILELLENKDEHNNYKKNISKIKDMYRWQHVVSDLVKFCENPYFAEDKGKRVKSIYGKLRIFTKAKYYFIKVLERIKKR